MWFSLDINLYLPLPVVRPKRLPLRHRHRVCPRPLLFRPLVVADGVAVHDGPVPPGEVRVARINYLRRDKFDKLLGNLVVSQANLMYDFIHFGNPA